MTGILVSSAFGGVGLEQGISIGGQVAVQLAGITATLAWSALFSYWLLKIIDGLIGLRVSAEDENQGLDIVLHEESGYKL